MKNLLKHPRRLVALISVSVMAISAAAFAQGGGRPATETVIVPGSRDGCSLQLLNVVPLELNNDQLTLPADVNGKTRSFQFDTAALTEQMTEAAAERLGLHGTGYEGPTGIVGVLSSACLERGIPSASLWASVPHYVAAAPNPKAALALVRKLESLVGVSVDASELESAAADYERQVGLAVQSDPDVQAFVERLEQLAADEAGEEAPPEISGDRIAREFQRFLRQRGSGDEG